jgi:peptide/nickel transport system substrate-binding protein
MTFPNTHTPARTSRFRLRRPVLATLALGLAVTLSACAGTSSPETSASGEPVEGGTLKVSFLADNTNLVSLDPFQVYWLEHRVLLRNVTESLTDQDPETGEIIPWLATEWQISDDGLEYTFSLRDDVTFSNGEPFDATAVKTAFDSNKAFAAEVPSVFGATYLKGYDHSEIIDDQTIKVVLSTANAAFLQATSTTNLAILAPESYALTAAERSLGAIIGTGPFTLDKYTPEVGVWLSKRAGYNWASDASTNPGEAYLDEVEVTYTPEDSVRNGNFLQGTTDIAWPRNPFSETDLALLESGGATIQTRSLPGPAWNYYPNASEGKILSDPVVRQALQKSIDREAYASTIYSADFTVVEGPFDQTTPFFESQVDALAHDPEGAAELLEDAGWELGDDGYRYKDGEKLTLVRPVAAESPGEVLVQDQLRQVGIDLEIKILVAGQLTSETTAGNYDLTSTYMTRADPAVLQTILDPRFANNSTIARNSAEADTAPAIQALYDAGLAAIDPAERAEVYADLQELLIDENVAFPVYERLWQAATAEKVQNFSWTSEGFATFNQIWLSE